jgi:hypothetical protein
MDHEAPKAALPVRGCNLAPHFSVGCEYHTIEQRYVYKIMDTGVVLSRLIADTIIPLHTGSLV